MSNVLDFFLKLKSMNKSGSGLPPQETKETYLAEYLGPAMHAKLYRVHQARKRRGGLSES